MATYTDKQLQQATQIAYADLADAYYYLRREKSLELSLPFRS